MASASFRESMNSLGWSRREADAPVSTAAPSVMDRVSNLFGAGGYVRLPISESNPGAPLPAPTRREEEEGWFACKYMTFLLVLDRRSTSTRSFISPSTPETLSFAVYIRPCNTQSLAFSSVWVAPQRALGGLVIASADSLVRLGPLCLTRIMQIREHGNVLNSMLP